MLALALGKSVRELLASMDSAELSYWMALSRIEPIGPDRQDHGFAMLASILANVNSGRGRKFTVRDFLGWQRERTRKILTTEKEVGDFFERLL